MSPNEELQPRDRFTETWRRLNTKVEIRAIRWLEAECIRRENQHKAPFPLYRLVNEIVLAAAAGRLQYRAPERRRGRPRKLDKAAA